VDDTDGVCSIESIGNLNGVTQRGGRGHSTRRNQLAKGLPGDILHDHELLVALGDDVMDSDDVGMIQAGGGLCLQNEPPAPLRVVGISGRENLNGDNAIQPGVLSPVNFAHPTGAQPLQNLVMQNRLAHHTI